MNTVTLSEEEYEDLIDSRDHAMIMRDVATGGMEVLGSDAVNAYLTAPSPLAFWREYRGMTRSELAARAGVGEDDLGEIEATRQGADVMVFVRLSKALGVRIEDIVPVEAEPNVA